MDYSKKKLLLFTAVVLCLGLPRETYAKTKRSQTENELQQAKKITVKGVVNDQTGFPLTGATVVENGTTNGTITDIDGNFSLSVAENAVLNVSFIGYKSLNIPVDGRTTIDVVVEEDVAQLEEVVVVGFGSQKKVNLTGSVAVADAETFEARPVTSAAQALQGVMPGLNISTTSGDMGSSPSLNIRGVATIGAGSSGSPLVLIDGMEGDINSVNPQDIDNISVLKDVASSSIYGSRAPFGVILITTKKGSKGGINVNYNNSFRFSHMMNLPKMCSSVETAHAINDAMSNAGKAHSFTTEQITKMQQYIDGEALYGTIPDENNPSIWSTATIGELFANTDWYDELYKNNVFGQEHNLSISGGNEKHQVYASANYLKQEGYMNYGGDGLDRFASTLKASGSLLEGLTYNYSFRYQRQNFFQPSVYNTSSSSKVAQSNFFNALGRNSWQMVPAKDPNGYPFGSKMNMGPALESGTSKTQKDNLVQQFSLHWNILKNWNITGEINYSTTTKLEHTDQQQVINYDVNGVGYYQSTKEVPSSYVFEKTTNSTFLNPNVYTDYSLNIDDKHDMKFMLGFQSESMQNKSSSLRSDGILVHGMDVVDVTSGFNPFSGDAVTPIVRGSYWDWATMGIFSRINYNYMGKYLVEANLRYDGTSRFRAKNRWATFPSFSLGWNIAREAFWEDLVNKVNTLKLRVSYGELGNQNTTSYYPTYSTMKLSTSSVNYIVNGALTNGAYHPALISSDLTWETVKNTNIGLDFALFNNRLTGSYDYFIRNTENMVGPSEQKPVILGASVPDANNTNLSTKGWELSLRWNDVTEGGFGYSIGLQLSDSKTEITKYPNESMFLKFSSSGEKWNRLGGELLNTYYTGQMVGEIWGYETHGIARTPNAMDEHLKKVDQTLVGSKWAEGDVMFKDIDGDGKITQGSYCVGNSGDLKVLGNSTPRYNIGLDLSADYKNFDVRLFFQGVLKRDFYTSQSAFWGLSGTGLYQLYATLPEYLDYYRPANTESPLGANVDSYYPRANATDIKNMAAQDNFIQNAAYLRLKNAQIGYTFNEHIFSSTHKTKIRVFVSGENLLTFTKLSSIYDPETAYGGWGGISYPLQTTISTGLNLTF